MSRSRLKIEQKKWLRNQGSNSHGFIYLTIELINLQLGERDFINVLSVFQFKYQISKPHFSTYLQSFKKIVISHWGIWGDLGN
jgi:hypothetical protein